MALLAEIARGSLTVCMGSCLYLVCMCVGLYSNIDGGIMSGANVDASCFQWLLPGAVSRVCMYMSHVNTQNDLERQM